MASLESHTIGLINIVLPYEFSSSAGFGVSGNGEDDEDCNVFVPMFVVFPEKLVLVFTMIGATGNADHFLIFRTYVAGSESLNSHLAFFANSTLSHVLSRSNANAFF